MFAWWPCSRWNCHWVQWYLHTQHADFGSAVAVEETVWSQTKENYWKNLWAPFTAPWDRRSKRLSQKRHGSILGKASQRVQSLLSPANVGWCSGLPNGVTPGKDWRNSRDWQKTQRIRVLQCKDCWEDQEKTSDHGETSWLLWPRNTGKLKQGQWRKQRRH